MTGGGKRVRRRQKNCRRTRRIFFALFLLLLFLLLGRLLTSAAPEGPEATAEPEPTVSTLTTPRETPAAEPVIYHEPDPQEILAKLVWGEARGCSATEQAAVVWCVMNRVDDGQGDIVEVATAPFQFCGYDPGNPVDADILALVQDVLIRWSMEHSCVGSVGRVLPKEYLYFNGNGVHNYFTTEWKGGRTWDWSLESPYKED
nr:MAG TPA: Spore cortex-lytic enzyme, lytic transglycosylase [Caudoviricetes sp.]